MAIIAFARGVTRARAGTPGTASVNTVRLHTALGHNHFRFRHRSIGRSGPTCTSRGEVATQPFERVERSPQSGQIPTHSAAVNTPTSRVPSARRCTDSTTTPSRSSSSELPSTMPASLVLDASRTPSSQGRGPLINHRHDTMSDNTRPPLSAKSRIESIIEGEDGGGQLGEDTGGELLAGQRDGLCLGRGGGPGGHLG